MSLRVLVVDDHPDTADSLCLLMGLWGYHCVAVYDAETALSTAVRERPHVVVLDLGLPRISGLEVARRLRAEANPNSLLLIAMTGHIHNDMQARSLAAGCDHFLPKPADPEQLRALLDDYADRHGEK